MSERQQYLDISKGIGIICVIVGHTITHGSWLFNIIFSFHMPLFFIVSGILFKRQAISVLVSKRFSSLVVPYLTTAILLFPFALLRQYIKYGEIDILKYLLSVIWGAGFKMQNPSGIEPIGAIWFLLAMFWAQVIYNYSPKDKRVKFIFFFLIALIGWSIGIYYWLPLDICVAMVAILYLWMGESIVPACNELIGRCKYFMLIFPILWIVGWSKTLGMVSNLYPFYAFSLITSFSGCFVILQFSKWLERIKGTRRVANYLSYMGRYSLAILCFHLLELKALPLHLFIESSLLRCLIKVIMLSLIPIIVSRIPYLSNAYKLGTLKWHD